MERRRRGFESRSPLRSFFWVTRDMIAEPENFFRATRGGGYGGPTLYLLAAVLAIGLLSLLIFLPFVLLIGVPVAQEEGPAATARVLAIFAVVAVAFLLLVFPVFCADFAFLGAVVWHPFVALSVGVGRGVRGDVLRERLRHWALPTRLARRLLRADHRPLLALPVVC